MPLDSSVGRARDCRRFGLEGIPRSRVRITVERFYVIMFFSPPFSPLLLSPPFPPLLLSPPFSPLLVSPPFSACGLILLLQPSARSCRRKRNDSAVRGCSELLLLFHVRSQCELASPKANFSPFIERSRRLDCIYSIDADEAPFCAAGL